MKKKILTLCLCVILCSASVVFGTLAYFTDTEIANVSTITMGGVQIEWVDAVDKTTIENIEIFKADDVIIPGETKTATLAIKNTGTVDAYICVNVGFVNDDFALLDSIQLGGTTFDVSELPIPTKMIKVDETEYYFYSFIVENPLSKDQVWTDSTFAVTLSGTVKSDKSDYQIDVHFLAEAIQVTGFDNATAAFNAFDGKTN